MKLVEQRPVRKTQNLRIGRVSIPGARYFITICTKNRTPTLIQSGLAQAVLDAWRLQHRDKDLYLPLWHIDA